MRSNRLSSVLLLGASLVPLPGCGAEPPSLPKGEEGSPQEVAAPGGAEPPAGLEAGRVKAEQPVFYNNEGVAFFKAGDFDKAVTAYRSAIAMDPGEAQGGSRSLSGGHRLGCGSLRQPSQAGDPAGPAGPDG